MALLITEQRLDTGKDRFSDVNTTGTVIETRIVSIGGCQSHADFFHYHIGAHHIITFDCDLWSKPGPFAEVVEVFTGGKPGSEGHEWLVLHLGQADFPSLGQRVIRMYQKNGVIIVVKQLTVFPVRRHVGRAGDDEIIFIQAAGGLEFVQTERSVGNAHFGIFELEG